MTDLTNTSSLPVTVASGGVIGVGETGRADLDDPRDAALVDRGVLEPATAPAAPAEDEPEAADQPAAAAPEADEPGDTQTSSDATEATPEPIKPKPAKRARTTRDKETT